MVAKEDEPLGSQKNPHIWPYEGVLKENEYVKISVGIARIEYFYAGGMVVVPEKEQRTYIKFR